MRSAKKTNPARFSDSKMIIAKAHFNGINGQKCSSEEDLKKALKEKKVFLFVSIFSDDFRGPELDAMLSALCGKEADVVVVIVDGIQGINLVDLDYSKLSHEKIEKQVFDRGIGAANDWHRNNFNVISKYKSQNLSMRVVQCLNLMKDVTQFSKCKEIISELLNVQTPKAKQLQDSIRTTVEMHLKNKNDVGDWSRSQKYIEMELPYYMALACDGDFIAYTNKEPPAFKFVRELVKDYKQRLDIDKDPAGYIEFGLDRKNPDDLPKTSIEKILLTGGISARYPNGNVEPICNLIPTRTTSCPIPEGIPQPFQRRRSSSDGSKDVPENQSGFFARPKQQEAPGTPPSENQHGFFAQSGEIKAPEHTPSINEIMQYVADGRYQDALQKLVALPNTITPTIKSELISQIQELIKVREGGALAEFYKKILPYTNSDIPAACYSSLGNDQ